ncbi:MAG: ABC transporter ATP-binding protein [Bacteroidales bacterium]|nr:ABC transporter ATP-binding protein [Bacteroidales bacterium]
MKEGAILSVRDLRVSFSVEGGVNRAVDGVSFDVFPGETLALVGESGSGKSVTALSVMQLLSRHAARIDSGELWFRHPELGVTDLLKLSGEKMQSIRGRHISMVFQEPMTSLNPVKRCGWQVVESLLWHKKYTYKQARTRVLELFGEVRLPDPNKAFSSWPHELSGGQKQRVMIAMAMACEPDILIADEPTTALDVTVQKSILELLANLQKKHGMAVLFISHDLGVVRQIADRALIMRKAVIVEQGRVGDLFSSPAHPYTRALIACRPRLDERPPRLAVVDEFMADGQNLKTKPAQEEQKPQVPDSTAIRRPEAPYQEKAADTGAVPLLEVKNLKTYFTTRRNLWGRPTDYFKAVENISFRLYRGETLGLVGESGCGKTTLGRSIMRLIEPTAGEVIFKGRNIADLSPAELRKIRPRFQIIFQDPYSSLTPGLSVGRAIIEPMQAHRVLTSDTERKKKIMELLEKVGLQPHHYYRYPHEFSGGQRQRICIARALALEPEFIVCDESVSALDVSVQAQVLNLLNDLKREFGLTYIFISHDLAVVKYMSDRIIVMKDGRIEEINTAESLYEKPGSSYTKSLIEAIPAF